MDDLISRRAATRGCYDPKMRHADYHEFAQMIDNLPSAQPEPLTEEEMRLLKKLRSFHSGSYAKLLDKLVASAQPEPHWIPCSERLPEDRRQVLVYAMNVHFALAKYDEMREADGTYKKQWVTFDAWKPYYKIKDVIAWMPLPEPWRGES